MERYQWVVSSQTPRAMLHFVLYLDDSALSNLCCLPCCAGPCHSLHRKTISLLYSRAWAGRVTPLSSFPPTPVLLLALAALSSHPCTSGHVLQIPVHCFALGYCLLKSTANSNCKEELHKGPWEKWEGGEEQGKIRKLYFNFLNSQMPTFPITWNVTHLCNTLCPSWTTVVGLPSPTQRCKASSTVLGGGECQPKWRM